MSAIFSFITPIFPLSSNYHKTSLAEKEILNTALISINFLVNYYVSPYSLDGTFRGTMKIFQDPRLKHTDNSRGLL